MLVEMRKIDACGMEKFGTLDSSEKTIAILGDRWWPKTANRKGIRQAKTLHVTYGKTPNERQMLEVSIRSRHVAPSRKGSVVNGQTTKASNKRIRPPPPTSHQIVHVKGHV